MEDTFPEMSCCAFPPTRYLEVSFLSLRLAKPLPSVEPSMYLEGLTMTDERVFSRPNEFLPERWTTQPELVKDSSAFIPFNSGTAYHPENPILADVYPTYR